MCHLIAELISRDAVQAFANVQNGVHYAQSAKDSLRGQAGNSSEPSPPQVTTQNQNTASTTTTSAVVGTSISADIAAGTSISVNIAAGTIVTQNPVPIPTTFETVTQKTVAATRKHGKGAGAAKAVVTEYLPFCALLNTSSPTSTGLVASETSSAVSSSESCTSGAIDCIGGQFAQCDNEKWVLTSCPSGTTCTKMDGGVITCDYPTSRKLKRNHARRHGHGHNHVLIGPADRY
jgi:Carbohydrate binding domain (family 19)